MTEVIKTIGIFVVSYMFSFLLIYCAESFSDWRKNGCKFKCLCKHEYDFEFVNTFRRDALLKCRKCGKKKRIKNLSHEAIDKLLKVEEMKNKEQTNACYGCFGAANDDCDECVENRNDEDEE